MYEFYTLIERKGIWIYKYFGILGGILIPITIYFEFEPTKGWELAFIVSACLVLFLLQFARNDSSQAIVGVSTTLFGIFYIAWFLSFIMKLKYMPDGNFLVGFLLLVTKCGDIGAFVSGSLFGRHVLISRISPKKTVEGAVGGFIIGLVVTILAKGLLPKISFPHLLILGSTLGVLGQIGDLSESLIKRDCQVKDSGVLIPGMGGVLDVVDSLLFTIPFFYFYLRFLFKL
jgi:phosphatidate cytidylyltransferase